MNMPYEQQIIHTWLPAGPSEEAFTTVDFPPGGALSLAFWSTAVLVLRSLAAAPPAAVASSKKNDCYLY